jgi:hypothetical protein
MNEVAWEPVPAPRAAEFYELLPYVTHRGVLQIDAVEVELEVLQLSNGQRVITEEGMRKFLAWVNEGRSQTAAKKNCPVAEGLTPRLVEPPSNH